jgi:Mg2+ and Co2+ transporter CorA
MENSEDVELRALRGQLEDRKKRRSEIAASLEQITEDIDELEGAIERKIGAPRKLDEISGLRRTVLSILREANSPISVKDIQAKMEQQGYDFSSFKDRGSNISTTVKRLVRDRAVEVTSNGSKWQYVLWGRLKT